MVDPAPDREADPTPFEPAPKTQQATQPPTPPPAPGGALPGGEEGGGEADPRRAAGERTTDAPLPPEPPAQPSSTGLTADDLAALPTRPPHRRTRRRVPGDKPGEDSTADTPARRRGFTGEQRLVVLDTWQRSGLPAKDFAPLVGISPQSLYQWKKRFAEAGPDGLRSRPRGRRPGSRLPETTRRAIEMLKRQHPDWGQDRIHAVLERTDGYTASSGAIGRVLEEAGYVVEDTPTRPHPDKVRSFERARPNQLWQTDLFTFVLKRENRRVHLVAYLDDHSRFITGHGLHASSSGAMVREAMEAAITRFGPPEEVLTDNGAQYHTWRGKSAFRKLMERRGIRQIVARPRHPQTLGKVERFWGTLWRECLEQAVFADLEDARRRIALFVDHYNFQRPHSGIDQLVPADRYFAAAPQVRATLQERVADNALELAKTGVPRKSFYLTGRVGRESISLHGEGDKVVWTKGDGVREEVVLRALGKRDDEVGEQVLPGALSEGVAEEVAAPVVPVPEPVAEPEPDPDDDPDPAPSEPPPPPPPPPSRQGSVERFLGTLKSRLLGRSPRGNQAGGDA